MLEAYHDSAYLDRLHHYIPGWEVDTICGEMFSDGYGFVVDYIAEVVKSIRSMNFSDRYQECFTLPAGISTRDRDGVHKTFSGLTKILYPHGEATPDEIEEVLRLAIQGRKRVKDQIGRIDTTIVAVDFGYSDRAGSGTRSRRWRWTSTLGITVRVGGGCRRQCNGAGWVDLGAGASVGVRGGNGAGR